MEINKTIIYEIPQDIAEMWSDISEYIDESSKFVTFLSKRKKSFDRDVDRLSFAIIVCAQNLIKDKRDSQKSKHNKTEGLDDDK